MNSVERYVPEFPDAVFTRPAVGEHPKSSPLPAPAVELPAAGARVICTDNTLVEEYLTIGASYTVEYENTFTNYRLAGIPLKFFSKKRFIPDADMMRLVDVTT